jgi:large subunit ribosomal protein L6
MGRLPISMPEGVKVKLDDGVFLVEGPKGRLTTSVPEKILVKMEKNEIRVGREEETASVKALHGLTRKLIANMVEGVWNGFRCVLEINGVGYRAEIKDKDIQFTLGYSHPIVFPLPPGVSATVDRQTVVTLECFDKQLLGQTAAMIRRLKPPEPYKGKGIKFQNEVIRRKAGKAVGAGG